MVTSTAIQIDNDLIISGQEQFTSESSVGGQEHCVISVSKYLNSIMMDHVARIRFSLNIEKEPQARLK